MKNVAVNVYAFAYRCRASIMRGRSLIVHFVTKHLTSASQIPKMATLY